MKQLKWIAGATMCWGLLAGTATAQTPADTEQSSLINAKFYHIDIEPSLDKPYLKGSVKCTFAAIKAGVSSLEMDLAASFKVSKIEGAANFEQQGDKLTVHLDQNLEAGQIISFTVFYEGDLPTVQSNGEERGFLYKKHGAANEHEVMATACYPKFAYLWFPCVQTVNDKVDSIYVDVTIADKKTEVEIMNPNTKQLQKTTVPYIAVSNGVLEKTVKGEGKKTYQWRHRYRIAPQHVLVAVSNFAKISSEFKGKDYKLPIDFYVLPEKYEEAQAMVNRAPEVVECLSKTFGDYPFRKERFAVTQVGFHLGKVDGMPTQTNIIIESVKSTNIAALVQRTASMWFGNHISPLTAKDVWITEGLASYAEAMWQEYKRGLIAVDITMKEKKQFLNAGKLTETENPELLDKRGAYVIHMLRGVMSDAYFFEALKGMTSLKKMRGEVYGKTYITTDDFRKICQYYASENEDQNYSYFFDQWVNGEYFPIYEIQHETGKKGELILSVHQELRTNTTPQWFSMPATIKVLFEDSTSQTDKIVVDAADKTFTLTYPKTVIDVQFDPLGWIFKDLRFTRRILNTKTPITDFKLATEHNGRTLNLSFNSTKKQDVILELTELDPDGNPLKPITQTIAGATGVIQQTLKIPLDKKSRGTYVLRVIGKSDMYTKVLYLNRIEEIF